VARGVKEFNIIAQDLSSYGTDIYGKSVLAELVEKIAQTDGVKWIRLHYAYPAQFPYDILPVMAKYDNVCKYLDIALQHCSDVVLSNMRRHITGAETRELLARIRSEVPGIHIRTTLMVGFPGEGEAEFEELKTFVKEQKFERMGAFAYCEEDDTYAANNFEDTISQDVKQQRLDKIMALQEEIALESNQSKVGTSMQVICDSSNDEYFVCRSQYDSPEVDPEVLVRKGDKEMKKGEFYNVKIVEAMPFELIAELKD
jgi:ribosomal protein S12 methylthiotransferase